MKSAFKNKKIPLTSLVVPESLIDEIEKAELKRNVEIQSQKDFIDKRTDIADEEKELLKSLFETEKTFRRDAFVIRYVAKKLISAVSESAKHEKELINRFNRQLDKSGLLEREISMQISKDQEVLEQFARMIKRKIG